MSSCFSPPLLLFIAMRAFYELSLWITPHLLFTYQTCTTGCYGFHSEPLLLTARSGATFY